MKWKSLMMPKGIQIENPENIPNFARLLWSLWKEDGVIRSVTPS